MDRFFMWLEATPVSSWIRDAPTIWAFPAILTCHTIGMGIVAGINGVVALRVLGVSFHGGSWVAVNVVSGLAFLATEPDQYIYNPAFHAKVVCQAVAGFNALGFYVTTYRRATAPGIVDAPRSAKTIAVTSLCMWIG